MNHISGLTFRKEWLASLHLVFGLISQNNPAFHVIEDILCIKLLSILLILRKQRFVCNQFERAIQEDREKL